MDPSIAYTHKGPYTEHFLSCHIFAPLRATSTLPEQRDQPSRVRFAPPKFGGSSTDRDYIFIRYKKFRGDAGTGRANPDVCLGR